MFLPLVHITKTEKGENNSYPGINNMMMKRIRGTKASKAIDRLYREGQCRGCSVVVTRMDFAKILGKFTKVKIQYESNSTPKEKQKALREPSSPNSNSRLKSNENGMVLIHRRAYTQHPVEKLSPKNKKTQLKTPNNVDSKQRAVNNNNNILKENNRLKKTPVIKDKITKESVRKKPNLTLGKQYRVTFSNPTVNDVNEVKSKITLLDLLPGIDKSILPSDEWSIHYLPYTEEPKEDKVYDKIAAELEHLMYNEKSSIAPSSKTEGSSGKGDDFPSILDILNEKPSDSSSNSELKSNLASSDVEAMLLGEPDTSKPMNIIIEDNIEEPGSPSILDEALQKGIAEHLPEEPKKDLNKPEPMETDDTVTENQLKTKIEIDNKGPAREITHLVFKQIKDGTCYKSVICPKTLKYSLEFIEKPVELLGAPKIISSREDLQVLLQIANESELESFYVLH